MDPEAVLKRAADEFRHCQWGEVATALFEYYQWRVKGGFEPKDGDTRAESLSNRVIDKLVEVL